MMLAQDDHIEKLLLDRQVFFKLDDEWRAGEKVRQEQAKKTVPIHAVLFFHQSPKQINWLDHLTVSRWSCILAAAAWRARSTGRFALHRKRWQAACSFIPFTKKAHGLRAMGFHDKQPRAGQKTGSYMRGPSWNR